jgi:hypothetical protein
LLAVHVELSVPLQGCTNGIGVSMTCKVPVAKLFETNVPLIVVLAPAPGMLVVNAPLVTASGVLKLVVTVLLQPDTEYPYRMVVMRPPDTVISNVRPCPVVPDHVPSMEPGLLLPTTSVISFEVPPAPQPFRARTRT